MEIGHGTIHEEVHESGLILPCVPICLLEAYGMRTERGLTPYLRNAASVEVVADDYTLCWWRGGPSMTPEVPERRLAVGENMTGFPYMVYWQEAGLHTLSMA